ncbi:hypothetical protein CH380_05310 [Leptospira adleri]|uniref:Uncharacterized protein n=1 Tax=Leptospira adleri TaxID=2023186 RepID=A0A2M9YSI8_9LEPT|nr:hypothetical protein CH380_05310 [Leptospira adleri]PJZ61176.1 hypothetical protein CH376_14645 [Leptospira adleri]
MSTKIGAAAKKRSAVFSAALVALSQQFRRIYFASKRKKDRKAVVSNRKLEMLIVSFKDLSIRKRITKTKL